MSKPFKKIGLFGHKRNLNISQTLTEVYDFLAAADCEVCVEEQTAKQVLSDTCPIAHDDTLADCDLLVAVGGDGSFLHAAHLVAGCQVPIIGINRGRLGFLTDIAPDRLDKLTDVIAGKYTEEIRFLLTMALRDSEGKVVYQNNALNDVVLLTGNVAHMLEFDIYLDDTFVCHQRGDGLIVASPTGSTAYALSAGGPILHPSVDAINLIPMFSHSLSSRPLVVPADRSIRIKTTEDIKTPPHVSCDGQTQQAIPNGGEIVIYKNHVKLKLIHPIDYNYFDSLRAKLHWGG